MRGVAGPGLHGSVGGFYGGVGVADAHANLATRGFGDYFDRSGEFGSDGDHSDVTARGLPEAFKDLQRRLDQVFRRMHAAALVAEKWTFQMDAERKSLSLVAITGAGTLRRFDRVGDAFESGASLIKRRSHGGGKVAGDAVRRQKFVEVLQFGERRSHDVDSGAAVHMDIDEAWGQNGIWEIAGKVKHGCLGRNLSLRPRGYRGNAAILNKQERV